VWHTTIVADKLWYSKWRHFWCPPSAWSGSATALYACFMCICLNRCCLDFLGQGLIFSGEDRLATLLNSKHSRTSFSTQIVSFSRHLCSRRDARAGDHTYAKRTIIRKNLPAKFKYICIEQNWKYLYWVVITKTDIKSNLCREVKNDT